MCSGRRDRCRPRRPRRRRTSRRRHRHRRHRWCLRQGRRRDRRRRTCRRARRRRRADRWHSSSPPAPPAAGVPPLPPSGLPWSPARRLFEPSPPVVPPPPPPPPSPTEVCDDRRRSAAAARHADAVVEREQAIADVSCPTAAGAPADDGDVPAGRSAVDAAGAARAGPQESVAAAAADVHLVRGARRHRQREHRVPAESARRVGVVDVVAALGAVEADHDARHVVGDGPRLAGRRRRERGDYVRVGGRGRNRDCQGAQERGRSADATHRESA